MINILNKRCFHLVGLMSALIAFGWCADGFAAGLFSFGDVEKPNPDFVVDGDRMTANLIPRAKSTRISIEFQVTAGGTLDDVKGVDFAAVDRPEVDVKNFKSAVFEIGIRDVARGGSATVAIRSDFFTMSTGFYIFNPKRETPWVKNAQSENRALPQRVRELVVQVQDGGELDADGLADGHVSIIGGPRDSFWGYAMGTLFIRFFGIFVVLSILMAGMIASGWIFKAIDRFTGSKPADPEDKANPDEASQPGVLSSSEAAGKPVPATEEVVAAISAALYLRDIAPQIGRVEILKAEAGMIWALEGRRRIMNDRLTVFKHEGRSKK